MNVSDKIMRMRARPKILLCSTYEEAWDAFTRFGEHVLGVISDIEFPADGVLTVDAGLAFARAVRARSPDVPVLLQSSNLDHWVGASDVGATFLLKGSPTLLADLRRFMIEYLGFGDFVFRAADGEVLGRARDLKTLEEKLATASLASIAYHAERNHFSSWLKARTEFALAEEIRPRRPADFAAPEALRAYLIETIARYRRDRSLGAVADYDRGGFDPRHDFQRIGGGSLGGKARGLAFMRMLLARERVAQDLPGVTVMVPAAVVLATDVFDRFLDDNDLRDFAMDTDDDPAIERRFLAARFPEDVRDDLAALLPHLGGPLAVRSSSLLEDSQHQPFAGIYETFMLGLTGEAPERRLERLLRAIVRVYASTFSRTAKEYIRATPYRLEEEKMAVIVQRVVGRARGAGPGGAPGARFYPDVSGVARSHNFYPSPPLAAGDGIAAIALGLGRSVMTEGSCLRFCPRHPQHVLQLSSVREVLAGTQRDFWALDLTAASDDMRESRFGLDLAEADGALAAVASTYSPENDAISEGTGRPGVRVVTFAAILKHELFPLAKVLDRLLALGRWGTGAPVEIEFAVDLARRELAFLQLRPLALARSPRSWRPARWRAGTPCAGARACSATAASTTSATPWWSTAAASIAGRAARWPRSSGGSTPSSRAGRTCSSAWGAGARRIRGSASP